MGPLELYSWVGAAAASPLQITLCVGAIALLHSCRDRWRTVDLFLVTLFSQQLLAATVAFAFSIVRLMRLEVPEACSVFTWSVTALRTLQVSTVTSMAADRLLTAKWPYKYRYSVRRNQIRYHIGVLATVSVLVGTAALFSSGEQQQQQQDPEPCSFLPYRLSGKFSMFLLGVYGLLALLAAGSLVAVQVLVCLRPGLRHAPSDMNPLSHTVSDTSTASSTSGPAVAPRYGTPATSGTGALSTLPLPPNRRRRRVPAHRADEFRWPTVALLVTLSYLVNHLPYLALLVVGTFVPEYLPAWSMENAAFWMGLAEGIILVPLVTCVDPILRQILRNSCRKKHTDDFPGRGEKRPRGYEKDLGQPETKFPITNGSLFSLQDGTALRAARVRSLKMGVGSMGELRTKPTYLPTLYDPCRTLSTQARSEPLYTDPLTKAASLDSIIKLPPPADDEPIYATLSDGRRSRSPERCNSATTDANDDFEFRGSKRFCGAGQRRPGLAPAVQDRPEKMSIRSTASGVTIRIEDGSALRRQGAINQAFVGDQEGVGRKRTSVVGIGPGHGSLLRRNLALSMNDLDSIEVQPAQPAAEERKVSSVNSRMSCYGVPCHSENDLLTAVGCGSSERASSTVGLQAARVRASPRCSGQRVLRYKKASPRRRCREPPLRSAIGHRLGPSPVALNEPRGQHLRAGERIVSVEALNQALTFTPYSYLDNGELYRHNSRSVPDFQKVFISGFL